MVEDGFMLMLMLMLMFIGEARIFDLSAKMEEAFCRGWRRVAVVMSFDLSHCSVCSHGGVTDGAVGFGCVV